MAFSGGVFSLVSGNPVTTATTISSTWANNTLNDIATNGLTMCVLKDGSQTLTANIPFGAFKITGLGAGTAATDGANLSQAQSQHGSTLTSVSGTNTITATATPTPAYAIGQKWTFVPANTNTGATTLNISSLGAGAVQLAGAALTGGELVANTAVTVVTTAATPVFEIIGMTQFPDTRALIVGGTDSTKKVRFEADGITTGTTRVLTVLDADFSIGAATNAQVAAATSSVVSLVPSNNLITLGTEQASTSGTSIDFTGIPAGTRRINIMFMGVSSNGTSPFLVQIGDAGGPETSGYVSAASNNSSQATSTAGFILVNAAIAAVAFYGLFTITLENSSAFSWVGAGCMTGTNVDFSGGGKSLSAELTQVRITTVNGTDAFDAGVMNISYER